MNVRVTRTIVIAAAFTMVAAVIVDSASAQLFRRNGRNANRCCVPVNTCCSTQHDHGGAAYGTPQPGYATSYPGMQGRYQTHSGGYVSGSNRGAGSQVVNHNCCGTGNVVTQGYNSQGYNAQGYNAQGYTEDQRQTNSSATFDAPGSSSTQRQSSQTSGDANLQLNQDGTIRSNDTIRNNTDLNLDGSIDRSNSNPTGKSAGGELPGNIQDKQNQE